MPIVPEPVISTRKDTETGPGTSVFGPVESWHSELSRAVRSADQLLGLLGLSPPNHLLTQAAQNAGLELASPEVIRRFPVLVPHSFLRRMKFGDPHDPLLRQMLPLASECDEAAEFVADAVGDLEARKEPGMLQKYAGRVLLIAAGTCAVHCRYCFRREYPYTDEPRRLEDWTPALRAIEDDASITEVILSGGDPLMLSDDRLQQLCAGIDSIPHVERIRFHTRLPIVLPSRVTSRLLSILSGLRAQSIIVVHANHGNEVVGECADVLRTLVRAGIPVLNQAVLLAGINDTTDDQEHLCRRLINLGVIPYYLHQLDRVSGAVHFEVEATRGLQILDELAMRLPGYAVPRYVQEIAGESSKTTVASEGRLFHHA